MIVPYQYTKRQETRGRQSHFAERVVPLGPGGGPPVWTGAGLRFWWFDCPARRGMAAHRLWALAVPWWLLAAVPAVTLVAGFAFGRRRSVR